MVNLLPYQNKRECCQESHRHHQRKYANNHNHSGNPCISIFPHSFSFIPQIPIRRLKAKKSKNHCPKVHIVPLEAAKNPSHCDAHESTIDCRFVLCAPSLSCVYHARSFGSSIARRWFSMIPIWILAMEAYLLSLEWFRGLFKTLRGEISNFINVRFYRVQQFLDTYIFITSITILCNYWYWCTFIFSSSFSIALLFICNFLVSCRCLCNL